MPSWIELQHFLAHGSTERAAAPATPTSSTCTARRRACADWPELAVLAFDHRSQFEELAGDGADAAARASPASRRCSPKARGAARRARAAPAAAPGFGVIVDDRYGEDVLPALTGIGWWVARPVELPGSRPLRFEAGTELALALRAWPTEHVAKCLVIYHPDDAAALRAEQLEPAAGAAGGLPRHRPRAPDRGGAAARAGRARPTRWRARSSRSTPPASGPTGGSCRRRPSAPPGSAIAAAIERHDPHCRGVLLLGLEANEDASRTASRSPRRIRSARASRSAARSSREPAAAWFAGTHRRRRGDRATSPPATPA